MAGKKGEFTLKRQQVLMGSLFIGVSAAVAGGYLMLIKREYVLLHNGLKPAETSILIGELDRRNIRYRLGDGGTSLLVPASEVDKVRVGLAGAAINLDGQDGFELFDDSDMGLTDFAQKIKYQRALQGEISKTLHLIDGIDEARVHIAMPDRALFRGEQDRAKAAITLFWKDPSFETDARTEGVRQLVAAAVPDLALQDVIVLNGSGEVKALPVPSVSVAAPVKVAAPAVPARRRSARETELMALLEPVLTGVLEDVRVALQDAPASLPETSDTVGAAPPQSLPLPDVRPAMAAVTLVTGRELTAEERGRFEAAARTWRDQEIDIASIHFEVKSPVIVAEDAPSSSVPVLTATVDVPPLPVLQTSPPGAAVAPSSQPNATDVARTTPLPWRPAIAAILIGALLALGALLVRRLARGRAVLSRDDHALFADRLADEMRKTEGSSQRHAA
jgi:flagellar M-ring protein FliF